RVGAARQRIDARGTAAADVILAEERVLVGGAVRAQTVEQGHGRGGQYVADGRHAGAVPVGTADDGPASGRAHGASPGVVEDQAVFRQRFDIGDGHRAAVTDEVRIEAGGLCAEVVDDDEQNVRALGTCVAAPTRALVTVHELDGD